MARKWQTCFHHALFGNFVPVWKETKIEEDLRTKKLMRNLMNEMTTVMKETNKIHKNIAADFSQSMHNNKNM